MGNTVIILTGDVGVGKSTIAQELEQQGAIVYHETARALFEDEIKLHTAEPELHKDRYLEIQGIMLDEEVWKLVQVMDLCKKTENVLILLDRSVESVLFYVKSWHGRDWSDKFRMDLKFPSNTCIYLVLVLNDPRFEQIWIEAVDCFQKRIRNLKVITVWGEFEAVRTTIAQILKLREN